eukprot:15274875-Alexandrium_andersonii.AAC.1
MNWPRSAGLDQWPRSAVFQSVMLAAQSRAREVFRGGDWGCFGLHLGRLRFPALGQAGAD